MLVLSRRVEDSLVFPDLGITVEVLNMKGKSVRLGVDAPVEIKVLRGSYLIVTTSSSFREIPSTKFETSLIRLLSRRH